MKFKKLEPPHDPMPDMTAMVDLVMCILIFFMLGSKFVQSETFLPSSMPVNLGFGGSPPAASADTEVPLVLELKSGAFGVVVEMPDAKGTRIIPAPSEKTDDEERYLQLLAGYMKKVTSELGRRKADMGSKVRVVLKPDPGLQYRYIVGVFGAVLDAKFDNIAFAVNPGS